ncbi:MAG TPA: hypothetical protein VJH33_03595 [Candidatus Paceibacterota bacterium]
MHTRNIRPRAWGVAILACVLWVGVLFLVWQLQGVEDVWALKAVDSEQVAAREMMLAQLRTLVRETKGEREALMNLASVDVIHAIDVIEDAGLASGVTLDIGGAVADDTVFGRVSQTRTLALVVRAQSTFPRLVHMVALLETVSIPSEILHVELKKVSGSTSDWTLSARVRVTTTNINGL